jgi:ribosomal protein S18 acetylase RimI-like enzyme
MISFRAMTEKEYEIYNEYNIDDYAKELTKAGNCAEKDSLAESTKVMTELLPDGLKTQDHYFFHIENDNKDIGHLWYMLKDKVCFICDFMIYQDFRRQGFAYKSLQHLEDKMSNPDCQHIGLHVFGHNQPAIKLYKKYGFSRGKDSTDTNIMMWKKLD